MTKTCPKTGSPCAGTCKKASGALNITFANEKKWHKVTTIEEIFNIFQKCGDVPYMFVAGNTAHGKNRADMTAAEINRPFRAAVSQSFEVDQADST